MVIQRITSSSVKNSISLCSNVRLLSANIFSKNFTVLNTTKPNLYFSRTVFTSHILNGPHTTNNRTKKPTSLNYTNQYTLAMVAGNLSKYAQIGGAAFLASAGYYGYVNYQKYNAVQYSTATHLVNEDRRLVHMPQVPVTKTVTGPTNLDFNLTLFQYCSCPFCCKTRTFFDYFGVNYDIVEVNPVLRQQLKWSTYRKVPVVLANSKPNSQDKNQEEKIIQINDSSVIISSLGSFLLSKRNLTEKTHAKTIDDLENIINQYQPIEIEDDEGNKKKEIPNKYFLMLGDIGDREFKQRETDLAEERQWREWADNVLVHSLSPNIYRTIPEAMQAFRNFSVMGNWEEHFSFIERMTAIYMGSAAMFLISKRLKKKYNLKNDVRESLYDDCRRWVKAIGKQRQFMGGERPNLADLSVFGVLRSIEGCMAFDDLLLNTSIRPWYFAMKEACQANNGKQLVNTY